MHDGNIAKLSDTNPITFAARNSSPEPRGFHTILTMQLPGTLPAVGDLDLHSSILTLEEALHTWRVPICPSRQFAKNEAFLETEEEMQ